ncbi:Protein N-acetyltransferase, RimJ/RimL family [Promicromonospora umidemergens]|uniref:GNAT family protein n=1 Tax=Promicromonospora umidemergens TaxID=629679 RepID=A0ABP8WLQ3_9MICO|nr:GNAT family protein [Promicromonospora umidemergens]MCP2283895.1 Protein N-acetyltransferase, RimJ/RimL family [Promicromonospora umidemergens]
MDLATAFPTFGLRVACGDLELRLPDDAELLRLADVVVAGIHPPERRPFLFPWNVGEPDEVRRNFLQFHWSARGKVGSDAWSLELAVFRDGEPVGAQSVGAKGFPVTRSAGTGSWLGLRHHGQGIGKRMRLMALHLLFDGFDAADATTEAFDDNPESNGVTRSLGYAPNGVFPQDRQGEVATENRYRMTRRAWAARPDVHRLDVTLEGVAPVRAMLQMDPGSKDPQP